MSLTLDKCTYLKNGSLEPFLDFLWAREDSNLHGLLHTLLKRTRIPIPPRARYLSII